MTNGRFPIYFGISILLLASLACSVNFAEQDSAPDDLQARPLVRLLAPVNNSTFAQGTDIELYAIAQDSQMGVARIEFRLNDTQTIGHIAAGDPDGEPSLEARMMWTATGQQAHQLIVEAFRADGSSLGESAVILTVEGQPAEHDQSTPTNDQPAPQATIVPDEPTTATATSVPTPTERPIDMGIFSGPTARVIVLELPVRQGPSTTYPTVGVLQLDDIIEVIGRNDASTWWAIAYGEGVAWVLASQVTVQGDVTTLPLVAPP